MSDELEDFLNYIPEQTIGWEKNSETSLIVLKKPKVTNKFLVKYLTPYLKRTEFSINLDEIGSFVWVNIDGRTTIRDIASKMESEFGDKVKPVIDRLGQFISSLHQNKLIILKNKI